MNAFKQMLLAAAVLSPAAIVATPATAQVNGVAIADPQAAIAGSRAWTTARQQILTTYKPQLDQADARRAAAQAELQPLVTAFNTARAAPNANTAALQQQAQNIETRQNAASADIQRITAPAERAQQYVIEQIQAQLPAAVNAAVKARNVSLLLAPNAVLFTQPTGDITTAVTTELDRLVPTVGITPPANWQPGQQGQGGAAPGTAPAPVATTPARRPSGR